MSKVLDLLKNPQTFETLWNRPDEIPLSEKVEIVHAIYQLQLVIGVLGVLTSLLTFSFGGVAILNVVIPTGGMLHTMGENSNFDRRYIMCTSIYWFGSIVAAWLSTLFTFNFGHIPVLVMKTVISLAQNLAFARLWRALQDQSLKKYCFYLNVAVENKAEFIQDQAKKKVKVPGLSNLVGKVVLHRMADEKFLTEVGQNIEKNCPKNLALKSKGAVIGKAEVKFKKGNLIVVLITIEGLDLHALVKAKAGEDKANKFDKFLALLPKRMETEVQHFMASVVAGGLLAGMPEGMAKDMKEVAGLKVHVDSKWPAEEADFLFALLDHTHDNEPTNAKP